MVEREYIQPMIDAILSVGPFIVENVGHKELNKKPDGTSVTEIDIEAERRIMSQLSDAYPDVAILGEESGYDEHNLPVKCWLIDPIDGTSSFICGDKAFTTMAVLIFDNEAVACIINNPSTDELFYAIKDRGAWRNSKKLDLGAVPVPNSAFVKKSFTEQLHTLLKPVHISLITPPQGVGYGMAAVASADTAARFNFSGGGHVHDYATGILLVEEAGGVVVPLSDNDVSIHSKSFVACHPEIADFVREHRESLIAIEKQFS